MNMNNDVKEILLSSDEITKRCMELGKILSKDYENKKPIFVGLLKGSVPFMAELIKHIDIDMQMDFMAVSSYEGVNSTGHVVIKKDVSESLENRHVIIVEDIIDTGLTLSEVYKILKERNCASLEIVTLLDKPDRRTINEVTPKYIGFTIPNKFVIGFGLDYNELYRNLPYIGVLKESVYMK